MTDRNNLTRRDFVKGTMVFIGGLIGATIGIPTIAYLLSPSLRKVEDESVVDLGQLDEYPIGVPTLFEFTRTKVNGWERTGLSFGVFVLRQTEQDVRVFSDICTHLACRVSWHPDQEHYISPCHDGHFDITGGNISGPPPRPLDEFVTKIENGNLYIQLPAYRRAS